MRFLLLLLVALALTVSWQTAVSTDTSHHARFLFADEPEKDKKKGTREDAPGDEEPECE